MEPTKRITYGEVQVWTSLTYQLVMALRNLDVNDERRVMLRSYLKDSLSELLSAEPVQ